MALDLDVLLLPFEKSGDGLEGNVMARDGARIRGGRVDRGVNCRSAKLPLMKRRAARIN